MLSRQDYRWVLLAALNGAVVPAGDDNNNDDNDASDLRLDSNVT